jgi:hypothetical protein
VFVVALLALGSTVEAEAPALAVELGNTAYEAGLLLRGAMPVLVLRTTDAKRASDLLAKLRGRGHDAAAFDANAVVSSEAMTTPRSFRLDQDALVSTGQNEERLPFADVLAIVRAVHQTRTDTTTTTKEKKTSFARAALSGGLVTSKTVEKETSRTTEEREPVAYVFRRSHEAPWLFASTRLRYDGLGARLAPAQHENFESLLRVLLERAPGAVMDARLLAFRSVAERLRSEGRGEQRATSASTVDVLAHVVALSISRG